MTLLVCLFLDSWNYWLSIRNNLDPGLAHIRRRPSLCRPFGSVDVIVTFTSTGCGFTHVNLRF